MSTEELRAAVDAAMQSVIDPCSAATGVPLGLIDMGLVENVEWDGVDIVVTLRPTSPSCMQIGHIRAQLLARLEAIEGLGVTAICFGDPMSWDPSMMAPDARARLRSLRPTPKLSGT